MIIGKDDTKVIDKEFMEKELEYLKGIPAGMKTGFIDLDYQWGGLKPGCTYLIAARPAMGKTALALNIVQSMAIKENHRIVYFSLEQSKEQLVKRLLSMESRQNLYGSHINNMSEEGWNRVIQATKQIGNSNLIINDTPGISVEALEQELSKEIMSDVDVVIIDYLQLLNTEYDAKHDLCKINYICDYLKLIAENHGIAIVVLSQLTRRPEEREDHRPVLSDFHSKDMVNYFSNVSFIYRDEYYNNQTELRNIAEIITVRNKFGNIGSVNLAWLPEYQKFCNLERYSYDWEDEDEEE